MQAFYTGEGFSKPASSTALISSSLSMKSLKEEALGTLPYYYYSSYYSSSESEW